ncbi:MAG TPA: cytochrome c oxidase subunit II [Sandaracinaceae bacterium LLY-WYZ-13_1]|nr:cytochrome c oxidase subunit II [Sandaracinaceae bacterium LLY-WYZ-13_1]
MEWLRELLFLPPGAGSMADDLDALHLVVIGTTMVGAAAVFAVALTSVVRWRRRRPGQRTARVTSPKAFEVGVALSLIVLFVGFWVVGYRQYVDIRRPPDDALTVHVVAKQWMWKFVGPGGRRAQGVLVVPRGRDVVLRLTSRDVIHSFFVPAFRLKQDVLPGRTTTMWFRAERAGTYPVFCAEYCGLDHSRMRAFVVALDPPAYARWLEGERVTQVAGLGARADVDVEVDSEGGEDMITRGRALASRYGCFACHTMDGQAHVGPTWRGLYGSTVQLASGETRVASDDYLTESMMEPEAQRVAGYDTVMPSYRGVLDATETAAIVELIRSLEDRGPAPAVDLPPTEVHEAAPDAGAPATRDGGTP